MELDYNSNIKLLAGGNFTGGQTWNKKANDIDNCLKIYYFKEGKAQLNSCNQSWILEPGNLYFINGHSLVSQNCPETMSVDWLHFIPESVYINHILRLSSCIVQLPLDEYCSFFYLFNKFNDYFDHCLTDLEKSIVRFEIQSFVQLAISRVLKNLDPAVFEKDEDFTRLIPAMEYITQNYRQKISLQQVAEQCFLSPNYFHRLFKKTFKISPFNYIQQLRMDEALRSLIYSTKSIREIAFEIGLEDEAYFSRLFSKIYLTSPGRFRLANRKKLP